MASASNAGILALGALALGYFYLSSSGDAPVDRVISGGGGGGGGSGGGSAAGALGPDGDFAPQAGIPNDKRSYYTRFGENANAIDLGGSLTEAVDLAASQLPANSRSVATTPDNAFTITFDANRAPLVIAASPDKLTPTGTPTPDEYRASKPPIVFAPLSPSSTSPWSIFRGTEPANSNYPLPGAQYGEVYAGPVVPGRSDVVAATQASANSGIALQGPVMPGRYDLVSATQAAYVASGSGQAVDNRPASTPPPPSAFDQLIASGNALLAKAQAVNDRGNAFLAPFRQAAQGFTDAYPWVDVGMRVGIAQVGLPPSNRQDALPAAPAVVAVEAPARHGLVQAYEGSGYYNPGTLASLAAAPLLPAADTSALQQRVAATPGYGATYAASVSTAHDLSGFATGALLMDLQSYRLAYSRAQNDATRLANQQGINDAIAELQKRGVAA